MDVDPKRTDGEAIAASLSDPRAFGVVFERHSGRILRYLRRRLDDRGAEEATAQTFFVAFDERGRFDRGRSDARPWLFGIATNVARRHRRSELRELKAIGRLGPGSREEDDGADARLDAERLRASLARGLAKLPPEERDVLYLLVWAELDQPEIADALDVPLGTVKSRLHRARGRIQGSLGIHASDPPIDDLAPRGR